MGRLEGRWDRRQDGYLDGREPFTAQSAVMILAEPQRVWDFLHAPGSGVLLDHRHIRTFPVPETPPEGIGHQYCTFTLSELGTLAVTVSEVVEFDPPLRYVRKLLNSDVPLVEAHTLADVPGGSSYAVSLGLRVPAGTSRRMAADIASDLDEYTSKVKALVESARS